MIMSKQHKKKTKEKTKIWKEQQELRQDMMKEEEEEQRRTTRMAAIVAILAVAGAILTFFFTMTIKVLNIWSKEGIIFQYLQILAVILLSIMIMILIDMVFYLWFDLKRHDVLNANYKRYDKKSDEGYMNLIYDVKIYGETLGIFMIPVLFFYIIYGEKSMKQSGIILLLGIVGFAIYGFKYRLKGINKNILKVIVRKRGWKLLKLFALGIVCYYFVFSIVINSDITTINIDYNKTGIVVINNESSRNYESLKIEIYNVHDEKIYFDSVEEDKLLYAKEDKNIKSMIDDKVVGEGLALNDERLYWKYSFDLQEVIKEPGKYYIYISVYQNENNVVLGNTFFKDEKEYIFAKDKMKKNY